MTEDQLTLLELHELVLPSPVDGESLDQRFASFHAANPWVLEALEQLTREYLRGGARRVSVKMLTEVLRYKRGSTVGDTYKLNNSYTSRYARLLIQGHPEWDGLFETRTMPSLQAAS